MSSLSSRAQKLFDFRFCKKIFGGRINCLIGEIFGFIIGGIFRHFFNSLLYEYRRVIF